ncbi:MAG: MBL fold metallo-hydrolase [Promethearchaeota archaeon]|nr:MAG: MBL fold metallo-hydrolase [Candidatus Lokiarchaeota archaeon]
MKFTKKTVIIGAIGLIFIIGAATGIPLFFYAKSNRLTITFIYRAGIMLEHNSKRIYIDPYVLLGDYSKKPADAIFITHSHEDHLSTYDINKIYTESTTIYCPTTDASLLAQYNTVPLEPMEEGMFGKIPFQAFPMYTESVIHPEENNWLGYILDFNGFTLFHVGDSDCIPEYAQLEGKIDVLFLPIYDSYNMMGPAEVNQTIHIIKPRYMIPIHYLDEALEEFENDYVPYLTDTIFLRLQLGESHTFRLAQET